MNNVQLFSNPKFGDIRIVMNESNEPMFCLADVCKVLDLAPSKVVQRLEKDVLSKYPLVTNGGEQVSNFVSEEGLYDAILDSRKPEAKQFRKWVIGEVLPSIRKHGAYMTPQIIDNLIADPANGIKLLQALLTEREEKEKLTKELYLKDEYIDIQKKEINVLTPKANYHDKVLASKDVFTTTQIAKELGMSAVTLNRILQAMRIQYKQGGQWLLYAKYQDKGYTKTHTFVEDIGGQTRTWHNTVWTESGRQFIHSMQPQKVGCGVACI